MSLNADFHLLSHQRYCCGHSLKSLFWFAISLAWFVQNGLKRCCLPKAIKSALSSCKMVFAKSKVLISPTACVLIPTSFLIFAAKGTWNPDFLFWPEAVAPLDEFPPEEQSTTSTPSSFKIWQKLTLSSKDHPPSNPSSADIRTKRGTFSPSVSLTF